MSEKIIVLHPENQPEVDIYPIIKEGSIPNSVIDNQKIKSRTIINSNIALNTLKYEVLHSTLKQIIDSKITQHDMENYLTSYYYNVEETQQYVGSEISTLHQTIRNEFYSNTTIDNMLMEKTDLSLFREYLPSTYLNLDKQGDNQTSKLNLHANGSIFLTNSGNKTNSGNYYLPNSIVKTEDAPNGYYVLSTTNDDYQSLYNLGAYDKITTNSDGTYTITRQTGYVDIDNETLTYYSDNDRQRWLICNLSGKAVIPSINTELGQIITANYETKTEANAWDTNSGISLNTNGYVVIYVTTKPTGIIQYKLATATTEKVEKNHYAVYNQDFILEHNKSEAERSANLFDTNNVEYGSIDDNGSNMDSGHGRARTFYIPVLPNTYYSISANNSSLLIYELYQYDSNKSYIAPYIDILEDTFTFLTKNNTYYIRILFKNTSNTDFNLDILSRVMLNEGTEPLPYQPYEGKTIHEKDLENALEKKQDKLVSGTNIKKINGNDILGNGNITLTADSVFTKVEDNVTSLTISKNETYLITTIETYIIHVAENENINFYGSALVTTTGMLGGNPHININGVSHPLSTNTVTLISGGLFKAYKLN